MHIHIRGNEAESRKSQTALAAYSFTLVNERGLRKLLLIGILLFLDPLTISLIFTESARSTWTKSSCAQDRSNNHEAKTDIDRSFERWITSTSARPHVAKIQFSSGNPRAIKKERSKKRKKGGEKKKINQLPKTSNSNDSSHSLPSLSTLRRANEPRYRVRVVRWSGTEKGTGRGEEKKKKEKKKGRDEVVARRGKGMTLWKIICPLSRKHGERGWRACATGFCPSFISTNYRGGVILPGFPISPPARGEPPLQRRLSTGSSQAMRFWIGAALQLINERAS